METLVMIIVKLILWSGATYLVVDKTNKIDEIENSEFKANPWSYVALTLLFGFISSMAFFMGNRFKFENRKNAYIIAYAIGFIMIVLNLALIFV